MTPLTRYSWLAAVLAACNTSAPPGALVHDSAGVRITVNREQTTTFAQVSPTPSLSLGGENNQGATQFFQIQNIYMRQSDFWEVDQAIPSLLPMMPMGGSVFTVLKAILYARNKSCSVTIRHHDCSRFLPTVPFSGRCRVRSWQQNFVRDRSSGTLPISCASIPSFDNGVATEAHRGRAGSGPDAVKFPFPLRQMPVLTSSAMTYTW